MRNVYEEKEVVANYNISRTIPQIILGQYVQTILAKTGSQSVLDVGFGTGSVLIPFSKQVQTTGVDSSQAMCEHVASQVRTSTKIIQGDALELSSLVDQQELVHTKAVTHLFENPRQYLDSLSSVVADGAYLVIGMEQSQPEDNLENIGAYGIIRSEDPVLKDFYETYFSLRHQIGKPFQTPKMPAGNFTNAREYLCENGFDQEAVVQTPSWSKVLTLSDLLESMKIGTFSVFRNNVSEGERNTIVGELQNYCVSTGYDLAQQRNYDAKLQATILQKVM